MITPSRSVREMIWFGLGGAVHEFLHEKGGLPIQDRRRLLQEMYQSWPFFNTLLSNIDMVLAKKAALGMSGWRRMACGWPISSSRV